MNKKILFVTAAILLPLSMMGCQKKKEDKHGFKDNLSYGEQIEGEERDQIFDKVFEKLSSVVSSTEEYDEEHYGDLFSSKNPDKTTITYYDNYYKTIKSSSTFSETRDGITFTEKYESETHNFISSDGQFSATRSLVNDNGEKSLGSYTTKYVTEESQAAAKRNFGYPEYYTGRFEYALLFKKGKSYAAVETYRSEQYVPQTYGNDTKVKHDIYEYQSIYEINSKFEITKYTVVNNEYSNYDSETHQYHDEVMLQYHSQGKTTYKYGTRKSGDFSQFEEQYNKPFQTNYSNFLDYGKYAEGAWSQNGEKSIGSGWKYYTTDRQHNLFSTTFTFTSNDTNNSFILYHTTKIREKYITEAEDKELHVNFNLTDQIANIEGLSIVGTTEKGDQIILAEPGEYKLRLQFVIAVTGVDSVEVQDLSLVKFYPSALI